MKKKAVVSILLSGLVVVSMVSCSKGNAEPAGDTGDGNISSSANSEVQGQNEDIENMTAAQLSTEANDQTGGNSDQDSQDSQEEPPAEEPPAEEPSYFTEVSEEVWATGTVNIRAEPSMEGEILGQFRQGDMTVRTGIGIEEYSDWSRVEFGESTVYVATSYLSTTEVNPPSANTSQPASSSPSSSSNSSSSSTQSLDELNKRYRESAEALGMGKAGFARPPESPEERARIDQENFDYQISQGRKPIYEEDGTLTGWEWDY